MRSPQSSDRPRDKPLLRLVKSDVILDDRELSRRVLRSIATAEAIRGNHRAACSHPDEVAAAEELAMLLRAQHLLARALNNMPS